MSHYVKYCNNHSQIAQGHNLEQYKNKPLLNGLLKCLTDPLQDIEDELFNIYENASLNRATSYYLDRIGAIIGEDRNYRNDENYRLAIRIRIIANNGGATADEIIIILRSIYDTEITYSEYGMGYFQVYLQTPKKPSGIGKLLKQLKPIGVGSPSVVYTCNADVFRFSENCQEQCKLLIKNNNDKPASLETLQNDSTTKKLKVSFDSFERPSNTNGFAEIVVHRFSLKLDGDNKYLVNQATKLEVLMSYEDFIIEGGSCYSEVIENE